ncbi:MAG: sugar phosphate isomerase/epimerase [Deltaproteobacteria bacterium]|jgi:sugar phosphate isomerase/epimerase|nr:sugar phosphate isomerase/epimerase [Deltaproteobacteria bacterium]
MLYGAMNFPVRPILEEIDEIAALGFDYLELAMDPPDAHYSTIRDNRPQIQSALSAHSMQLVCHLPTFVSIADLTESIRQASLDEMYNSLEVAAELNALKVVLHPGHIGGLASFVMDMALDLGIKSLNAIIAKAHRLGLSVCLENMFPRIQSFYEPSHFTDILERLPDLKLTLDSGHANIGVRNEQKIFEFIRQFGNRIGHVHLSDNLGHRDDHLPIGEGTINFQKIAEALNGCGYDDTITLEIFSEDRRQLQVSRDAFAGMLKKT